MEITNDFQTKKTFTLDVLEKGDHAAFLSVVAGRGITTRLTSLGFTPGALLEMMQNYGRGPLVVTIRGTRVALGRQEARRITVCKV